MAAGVDMVGATAADGDMAVADGATVMAVVGAAVIGIMIVVGVAAGAMAAAGLIPPIVTGVINSA